MADIISYKSLQNIFMEKVPLVSVIITTKNSSRTLEALLKSIKDQSYKNFEIILVDNFSTDKTIVIAEKYIKKIYQMGPERSVQRNLGAKKALGKFYLILDSDMVLSRNVIEECVDLVNREPDVKEIIIPEKSFGLGVWSEAKALERKINEGETFFESARFFLKESFWEFRGFDENITGPEDWDLPQKIAKKYKVGRIKSYISHNEGRHTLLELAQRKYYYGLSTHKYLKNQKLPIFSKITIYFLRPAFYKKWKLLITNPLLTFFMIIMLTVENIAGGLGYILGRLKDGK